MVTGGRPCDAVLFDFDGVLVDTETTLLTSWQEVFRALGVPFGRTEYLRAGFHSPPLPLEDRVAAALAERAGEGRAVTDLIRSTNLRMASLLDTRPGVRELIADARRHGVPTGVVSSSGRDWVGRHLARLDLASEFDVVVCREDVRERKPAPEPYAAAVARLGVDPGRALAVEDAPLGVRAAKAAGLRCVAVPGPVTASLDFAEADAVVTTVEGMSLAALVALTGPAASAPTGR